MALVSPGDEDLELGFFKWKVWIECYWFQKQRPYSSEVWPFAIIYQKAPLLSITWKISHSFFFYLFLELRLHKTKYSTHYFGHFVLTHSSTNFGQNGKIKWKIAENIVRQYSKLIFPERFWRDIYFYLKKNGNYSNGNYKKIINTSKL